MFCIVLLVSRFAAQKYDHESIFLCSGENVWRFIDYVCFYWLPLAFTTNLICPDIGANSFCTPTYRVFTLFSILKLNRQINWRSPFIMLFFECNALFSNYIYYPTPKSVTTSTKWPVSESHIFLADLCFPTDVWNSAVTF